MVLLLLLLPGLEVAESSVYITLVWATMLHLTRHTFCGRLIVTEVAASIIICTHGPDRLRTHGQQFKKILRLKMPGLRKICKECVII